MKNDNPCDIRETWRNQSSPSLIMPPEELHRRAQRLNNAVRWRNIAEYCAAALVIAANAYYVWHFRAFLLRVGAALLIAGVVFVVWHLHREGAAKNNLPNHVFRSSLDFLLAELERQRNLLRGVWSWYLLPLFPGLTALMLGLSSLRYAGSNAPVVSESTILKATVACVIGFSLIAFANSVAARKLQRQIDFFARFKEQELSSE